MVVKQKINSSLQNKKTPNLVKNEPLDSDLLQKIEPLLSAKKMSFYKENFCENWFAAYIKEVCKARELFVYLHFFEVFLRE